MISLVLFIVRIIKQAKLRFTEGTSDKVYEVDLCQTAEDEYVVNFRFGKHGARLREGTKTTFPVHLEAAEQMYQKLVDSKLKKGYYDQSAPSETKEAEDLTEDLYEESPNDEAQLATPEQKSAILNRLTEWQPTISQTEWSLSRVIWRAGQLKIKEALPLIARHIKPENSKVEQYSIAWAIAQIKDPETSQSILDKLESLAKNRAVERIIREARLACMNDEQATLFIAEQRSSLSEVTASKLGESYFADYLMSEEFYKMKSAPADAEILYTLALLDKEMHAVLADFAKRVEISSGSFRIIRLLYKLSEARKDSLIYGTLVNRLEYETCKTQSSWQQIKGRWEIVRKGVFSRQTKKYFKLRSVRNFEVAGKDGDVARYITLATGVLANASKELPLNPQRETQTYAYNPETRSYSATTIYAPRYGNLHCFTWLLRGRSSRLYTTGSLNWSYHSGETPEEDAQDYREEPFPEFWDQAPDAIIHLLKHAQLDEVHAFAHKVWKVNPEFVNELSVPDIVAFIQSDYTETKRLGLGSVEKIWDAKQPNFELLEALILSGLDEAREVGFALLSQVIDTSLAHLSFIAAILLSPEKEVHEGIRGKYLGTRLPNVYAQLATLQINSDRLGSPQLAVETLSLLSPEHSADVVSEGKLQALLSSDSLDSMWFALHCYHYYAKSGKPVPEFVVIEAIESEHAEIRSQGVKLLESFSDGQLLDQVDLIASCCSSKSRELRQGILPVMQRLVELQPSFAEEMVESLYPTVLRKEPSDGVHDDVLALLLGPFSKSLSAIPDDYFRRMLKSKYAAAHRLGFHLLEQETKLADESLLVVLEWANHPHSALREAVLTHLKGSPERLLMQLSETRQLVESEWDEVRDYGMHFLREEVHEERWTVEALVDLCDSVKPLVQDFGREMITKRFREEDGEIYMTKLSQHPAREIQLFATNFLRKTACDQPEIILNLEFYFRIVMGAVSSGRVAKDRVLDFLKQESQKDKSVAEMAMRLWSDHSATCAIGDKANYLRAILELQRTWPELDSPLQLSELEKKEVRV